MAEITKEQVAEVLASAAGASARDHAALRLAARYALRVSEIVALRWEHIRDGEILISGKKGGQKNWSRLYPDCAAALAAHAGSETLPAAGFVFAGRMVAGERSRAMTTRAMQAVWYRHSAAAGVAGGIHSLRRAAAEMMIASGVPIEGVQDALRHQCLSSTLVYLRRNSGWRADWQAKYACVEF